MIKFTGALFSLVITSTVFAQAPLPTTTVPSRLESDSGGFAYGFKVYEASLEAPRFTGFIPVHNATKLIFEVLWDDVTGNVTKIEALCWTARDTMSFGSGNGYKLTQPVSTSLTGETVYKQKKFSFEFADGDTAFELEVDLHGAKLIACGFYAGDGISSTGDKLTVWARGTVH